MRLHWPLIALGAVFLTPVLAAGILLSNNIAVKTVQHGVLLQPPQNITTHNLQHLIGNTSGHKWQVIYVMDQTVPNDTLQILQNLHAALGAERNRVNISITNTNDLNLNIANNSVLIINPEKLCIMEYPNITNYSGLLKDLRRLLKYSHV
jgi:hypothetical protein